MKTIKRIGSPKPVPRQSQPHHTRPNRTFRPRAATLRPRQPLVNANFTPNFRPKAPPGQSSAAQHLTVPRSRRPVVDRQLVHEIHPKVVVDRQILPGLADALGEKLFRRPTHAPDRLGLLEHHIGR